MPDSRTRSASSPRRAAKVPATCWARGVLGVIEIAVSMGAARSEMAHLLGLNLDELAAPDRRVPVATYHAAIELAATLLKRPHFGLDYIDRVQPESLDVVGFYAAASATVGEAFQRILRFQRFLNDGELLDMAQLGDEVVFSMQFDCEPRPALAHLAEMHLADCVLLVPRITGHPVQLRALSMCHDVPDRASFERRIGFDAPVYNAPRYEWRVDAAMLTIPMPRPDEALSRFLESVAADRAASHASDRLGTRLQRWLEEHLASGAPSLDDAAAALGVSRRSLQRQLEAEGSSFGVLLDRQRQRVALRCLARGGTAEEAAYLAGYSEPSAFHRARRRWRSADQA